MRIIKFLRHPEWRNYFRYRWARRPATAIFAPFELLLKLIIWLAKSRFVPPARKYAGCFSAASHKAYPAKPNAAGPVYFFSPEEITALTNYARRHFSTQVKEILTRADKIMRGILPLVSGIEHNFGNRIGWAGPFADAEQLFCLNRWYHGIDLAKAFAYTRNEKYAVRFLELLKSWCVSNPVNEHNPIWESYSVSERIVNWLLARELLRGSALFRQHGMTLLRSMLTDHACYLARHLEDLNVHNHLINNGRALYLYGLLCPETNRASACRRLGWEIFTRELSTQFLGDGVLGEQSTHYHLLLLRTYAEVARLAGCNGEKLAPSLLDAIKQMFLAAQQFVRADGSLVLVGDISPDIDTESLVGILALGTAYFDVPTHVPLNEYALWFCDRAGLERSEPVPPPQGVHNLAASGFLVYRTPTTHLVLRCDPRTQVIRHGHSDVLGLELWVNRHAILSDSGNASYNLDEWEDYFRSAYAHSTIVVDGLPPFVASATLRGWLPAPYSRAEAGFSQRVYDQKIEWTIWHTGYNRLPRPVRVERRVEINENNELVVRDYIEGTGKHRVEILFQFGANNVEIVTPSQLQIFHPGKKLLAVIEFTADVALNLRLHRGEMFPVVKGWYSKSYGLQEPASTIAVGLNVNEPTRVDSRFTFVESERTRRRRRLEIQNSVGVFQKVRKSL